MVLTRKQNQILDVIRLLLAGKSIAFRIDQLPYSSVYRSVG